MSEQKTHLWKEETVREGDTLTLSAIVESPKLGRSRLWYKIPGEFSDMVGDGSDPFVIAYIFLIMREGADCIVHDRVSPSLMRNLSEFQAAWSSWRPEKYRQIEISAESEAEEQAAAEPALAVAAFSGGIDSCFTMHRHTTNRCPKHWRRDIEAGLFVHGFDIPLNQDEAFQRASSRIRRTLSSLDVNLITMSTNLQELNVEWNDTHIAGLASSLMLLKRRYQEGLIASGSSYHKLLLPWGSNPVTDHLLSTSSFRIVHDGAEFKRVRKREAIAQWSEGYQDLRICFSAERRDENCGRCSKCLTDILHMRIIGSSIPASFPQFGDDVLSTLEIPTANELQGFKNLVQSARSKGIQDAWVDVLSRRLEYLDRRQKPSGGSFERLQGLLRGLTGRSGNSLS